MRTCNPVRRVVRLWWLSSICLGSLLVLAAPAHAEKKVARVVKKGNLDDDDKAAPKERKEAPKARKEAPKERKEAAAPAASRAMPRARPPAAKAKSSALLAGFHARLAGYLHAGYRITLNNDEPDTSRPQLLRLGESDGFFIRRARVKFLADYDKGKVGRFSLVITGEFAADAGPDATEVSPAQRGLGAALRDAYLRYRHPSGFIAEVGQTAVPFGFMSERSSTDEHFIVFPLILGGEDITFGYPVRPILPRRDIGLRVGFDRSFGSIGLFLHAMVYNGNGANRFGNDSDLPAFAGRLGLRIGSFLQFGGSVLWNPRRAGEPPALFDETDLAFNADLIFKIGGFFLEGAFALQNTSFPTTGQNPVTSLGFHVDAGFRIPGVNITPVVRFELYDPSDQFDDDQLIYITAGVNWYYKIWRSHDFMLRLSYTFKLEQVENRTLNNDQFNIMLQYRF